MVRYTLIYVNFGQKVQDLLYAFQEPRNYVLPMLIKNSFWHARIGIFNLNRTYGKKIKLPSISSTNFHFIVLSLQFLFFIIKLRFNSTILICITC